MAVPLIIAGVVAAGIGAAGHASAKEINEQAQKIADEAQKLYDDAKYSLDSSNDKAKASLISLGIKKKDTLEHSVAQFLRVYDRIKDIQLRESGSINELTKLSIDEHGILELRELSNIYSGSSLASGAAGALTGLALGGFAALSSIGIGATSAISTVGAAGVMSMGLQFTPLGAIAAPVVLFTGISASIKADENLEKAQTMYSEAEAAAEQMRISETLCEAISDKSKMFEDLLQELDAMFSQCTNLLDIMTKKKMGLFKNKTLTAASLTQEELNLVAVTRALAGAVKAIIDAPLLNDDGTIATEAETVYNNTKMELPSLENKVLTVQSYNYDFGTFPVEKTMSSPRLQSSLSHNYEVTKKARHTGVIVAVGLIVFAAIVGGVLLFMPHPTGDNDTDVINTPVAVLPEDKSPQENETSTMTIDGNNENEEISTSVDHADTLTDKASKDTINNQEKILPDDSVTEQTVGDVTVSEDDDMLASGSNQFDKNNYDNTVDSKQAATDAIIAYLSAFVEDVNAGRYSSLHEVVESGSNMENMQQQNVATRNASVQLLGFEIISATAVSENLFYVKTEESYDVLQKNDSMHYYCKKQCTYSVNRQQDGTWAVSDFVSPVEDLEFEIYGYNHDYDYSDGYP